MDRQKAIECYNYFFAHIFRKNDKTESFLPKENIQIFYNLDDESKRDIYEHKFKDEKPKKDINVHIFKDEALIQKYPYLAADLLAIPNQKPIPYP